MSLEGFAMYNEWKKRTFKDMELHPHIVYVCEDWCVCRASFANKFYITSKGKFVKTVKKGKSAAITECMRLWRET